MLYEVELEISTDPSIDKIWVHCIVNPSMLTEQFDKL